MSISEAVGIIQDMANDLQISPYSRQGEALITVFDALSKIQKWIPVTERLPEEDTDVLVTVHFKGLEQKHPNGWNDNIKPCYYVEIASHIDGEWHSASDEYKIAKNRHEVIAWMELPEAYKE